jgi:low affinity Fe/Cu permease
LYVFNLLSFSTFYHSFPASMRFSSFIIICCIFTNTLVLLSYSNHITITTTTTAAATTITFSSPSITGYTKCEDELDEFSRQYRN